MEKILCSCEKMPAFGNCELEEGLLAKRCPDCHAEVLSLKTFQAWREYHFPGWKKNVPEPSPKSMDEKPSRARTCPACQRIMKRYRTGSAESFWLDHCPACGLVWLDDGEWKALQRDGLALHLDTLLTERWQQRVTAQRASTFREGLMLERFGGQEALDEIRRFKDWMNRQPNAKDILAYLSDSST